jgi:hypothetical protein
LRGRVCQDQLELELWVKLGELGQKRDDVHLRERDLGGDSKRASGRVAAVGCSQVARSSSSMMGSTRSK